MERHLATGPSCADAAGVHAEIVEALAMRRQAHGLHTAERAREANLQPRIQPSQRAHEVNAEPPYASTTPPWLPRWASVSVERNCSLSSVLARALASRRLFALASDQGAPARPG